MTDGKNDPHFELTSDRDVIVHGYDGLPDGCKGLYLDEDMALFWGEGRSVTLANLRTGRVRWFVDKDGRLLIGDADIDYTRLRRFNGRCAYCVEKSGQNIASTVTTTSARGFAPCLEQRSRTEVSSRTKVVSAPTTRPKRCSMPSSTPTSTSSCPFSPWPTLPPPCASGGRGAREAINP